MIPRGIPERSPDRAGTASHGSLYCSREPCDHVPTTIESKTISRASLYQGWRRANFRKTSSRVVWVTEKSTTP